MEVGVSCVFYNFGDFADNLYVLEYGQLALKIRSGKIVQTLLPGTMIGGLEFFSNQNRTCSLVAISDAVVWKLDKVSYEQVSKTNPALILNFVTKIAIPFNTARFYNTVHHYAQLR
jgi:CRP-like cAMP-binding protein